MIFISDLIVLRLRISPKLFLAMHLVNALINYRAIFLQVLVEPGTPHGSKIISQMRSHILWMEKRVSYLQQFFHL